MSVINDVLVELERRRASPDERRGISSHVRALPAVKDPGRGWMLVVAGGAALIAAGAGWFYWRNMSAVPPPTPAVSETATAAGARQPDAVVVPTEAVMFGRLTLELSRDPEAMPASSAVPLSRAAVELPATNAIPTSRVVKSEARSDAPSGEPLPLKAVREESSATSVASTLASATSNAPAATIAPAPRSAAPQSRTRQGGRAAPEQPRTEEAANTDIDKQVRRPTASQQAETEYGRALQSLQQGKAQDAREHLGIALRLNPEHVAARQTLLGILVQTKQFPDAERLMQDGLRVSPGQTRFTVTLARLQVDKGDVGAALETLQAGAPHAQGNPDYSAFFAGLLQRKQRHTEAVIQFQQALHVRPQTGLWWLGLGMSLQALGQKPDAQDAYRRALGTNNLSADMQAFADQQLRALN